MNTESNKTTNGIQISVFPDFVQEENTPEGHKYLFSYRVDIKNVGSEWAKLLSRHWLIINSEGKEEHVRGAGVVGYFPELKPGSSFTYTSYCPIDTEWGTMEGEFEMVREDGTTFEAEIQRFYLVSPKLLSEKDK